MVAAFRPRRIRSTRRRFLRVGISKRNKPRPQSITTGTLPPGCWPKPKLLRRRMLSRSRPLRLQPPLPLPSSNNSNSKRQWSLLQPPPSNFQRPLRQVRLQSSHRTLLPDRTRRLAPVLMTLPLQTPLLLPVRVLCRHPPSTRQPPHPRRPGSIPGTAAIPFSQLSVGRSVSINRSSSSCIETTSFLITQTKSTFCEEQNYYLK